MINERTPFDSIEGSLEYIALLREVIQNSKTKLETDMTLASAEGAARRVEALQIVVYKLDRLAWHVDASRLLLNDLRTLRRLLLGERYGSDP